MSEIRVAVNDWVDDLLVLRAEVSRLDEHLVKVPSLRLCMTRSLSSASGIALSPGGSEIAEHVLRKIHHCTFPWKISRRPFLGFYPKNLYIFSLFFS